MLRKLLIVNDNDFQRNNLSKILENYYQVIQTENEQEAESVLKRIGQNLSGIIIDTELKGFDFLEKIRANEDYLTIPILILITDHEQEAKERSLDLGANALIEKPYDPRLVVKALQNIISLRENAALTNSFRKDRLTGLLSRDVFFDECDKLIAEHEPGYYAIACVDLDNFKVINDQYGMSVGDDVLRHVARCIRECTEEIQGLACRFTADRFAVLYPASYIDSDIIIENQKEAMAPKCINRLIRIRIGRCIIEDLSVQANIMYERATVAEESIKGRYDRYIANYTDSMRDELLHEQKIVNEMENALKNGQFVPFLQPQYNHSTGALIGAEALVRWKKGDTFISPAEFIPIFEKNGFIYEVDRYIWEQVCILLRKWLDEGKKPLPVSVNISRYDLYREDFFDTICGLINIYKLPMELLRLEITESAFAELPEQLIHMVNQLIETGFVVEIDDFGSGYSSLNTLKDVPASILKLDMKFFEDTKNTQRSGNIVESIVRMAKWLGMAVIAEGVEEKEQADFLMTIGCYYIQGYYYARPMPVSEYEKLFEKSLLEPKLTRLKALKNLDNNEFWNPKSMETLIFNSYVGGACIFEYHQGEVELLRVNEQYLHELGNIVPEATTNLADMCPLNFLEKKDKEHLHRVVHEAVLSKKQATTELMLHDHNDKQHIEYIRLVLREIANTGERFLFYCVITNITKQRLAEKKQSLAEQKERMMADKLQAVMNHVGNGITAVSIYENRSELIFANKRFYEIIGYTKEQLVQIIKKDIYSIVYKEDRERVINQLCEINMLDESTFKFRIVRSDGSIIWVKVNVTVTNIYGIDVPVQLSVFMDITDEIEVNEQLRFLNESAQEILDEQDEIKAINKTLQKECSYFGGDRAFIIELDYLNKMSYNTYEVCSDGVESLQEHFRKISFRNGSFWLDKLKNKEVAFIDNFDELKDANPEFGDLIIHKQIHSIILSPLLRKGKLIGFVGIDNPKKSLNKVIELKALGDYLVLLLKHRDLNHEIQQENSVIQFLMNDTPGGFCKMHVPEDMPPEIVYANEGFCELLQMSHEEVFKEYSKNALLCFNKEDVISRSELSRELFTNGSQFSKRCRLLRKDGTYLWVIVFGRFTETKSGEIYLNSYFTEVTEQLKAEEKHKELLNNLPCGAALYEYDGRNLSVIHFNSQYWKLVQRDPVDYSNLSVFDAVHPLDAVVAKHEIDSAIRQKRDASCDIRIRCGKSGYKPFHVNASIIPSRKGMYTLYATYTLISEKTMSFQEMLPIALSTMMDASADQTYLKDRDLNYISCSQFTAECLGLENPRDINGKSDYDLLDEELANSIRKMDEQILRDGHAITKYTERIPGKDGTMRLAETCKYPLLDSERNVIGIYGISRDITEEKEKEYQLELLTNSIPGGLAAYSFENGNIETVFFNDGFYHYSGFSRDEYNQMTKDNPLALVMEEDRSKVLNMVHAFENELIDGEMKSCVYRSCTKNDGYRWMGMKCRLTKVTEEQYILNVVQIDITEHKEIEESLRMAEEGYRLATQQSGCTIGRYNVREQTLTIDPNSANRLLIPECMDDVPYGVVRLGKISQDTKKTYLDFFKKIRNGEKEGFAVFQKNLLGKWVWVGAHFTTIFADDGTPISAIISYVDVTDQYEKEAIFKRWQQSMDEREEDSYTLLRSNLSSDLSPVSTEGTLIKVLHDNSLTLNQFIREYAANFVFEEDRKSFLKDMSLERLNANFEKGKRKCIYEYREITQDDGFRWIRRCVDLIERPDSSGIMAYIMFEDIDESKRAELTTQTLAETDPLTGLLNRKAFEDRMNDIIENRKEHTLFAFLILDIDCFKEINDTLGHNKGDEVLTKIARDIRTALLDHDIVGRLGGDEFVIGLANVPSRSVIQKKTRKIWKLLRRELTPELLVSTSIGVAICSDDGADFKTLYCKADKALYHIKENGKDSYGFYYEYN